MSTPKQLTMRARFISEYASWQLMKSRCHRITDKDFKYYGARGVTVCDRWRFGEGGVPPFACFIADVGPKPTPGHTIDRIESTGNYEPDNCRWATMLEQNSNRRRSVRASSKFVGVRWIEGKQRWLARLAIPGKSQELRFGHFRNEDDAARAYDAAAIRTLGPSAKLNFPQTQR